MGFVQGRENAKPLAIMMFEGLMNGSMLRMNDRMNTPRYPRLNRSNKAKKSSLRKDLCIVMVKSVFLTIDDEVKARFPDLHVLTLRLNGVKVEERRDDLMRFGEEIIDGVRKKYDLQQLKDLPSVRAYRDFFWRVGVDPTKSRPASEALIRRVLSGKKIPNINTLVDAYNLASMKTEIALAAFDLDGLKGDLTMMKIKYGILKVKHGQMMLIIWL